MRDHVVRCGRAEFLLTLGPNESVMAVFDLSPGPEEGNEHGGLCWPLRGGREFSRASRLLGRFVDLPISAGGVCFATHLMYPRLEHQFTACTIAEA